MHRNTTSQRRENFRNWLPCKCVVIDCHLYHSFHQFLFFHFDSLHFRFVFAFCNPLYFLHSIHHFIRSFIHSLFTLLFMFISEWLMGMKQRIDCIAKMVRAHSKRAIPRNYHIVPWANFAWRSATTYSADWNNIIGLSNC